MEKGNPLRGSKHVPTREDAYGAHRKLIGTTLLVKGLEYDHAIALDADSLDAKHLYITITRGSKSLTIIGTGRYIPAK